MAEKPKSGKEKEAKVKPQERIMIIPLRKTADRGALNKRMNRSVKEIRAFVAKHMSADLSDVSISQQLNESMWHRGFHNAPASVKVKVTRDEEGSIRASMIDEKAPKKEKKSRGIRERLSRGKEEPAEKAKSEKPAEAKKEAPSHKEDKPAAKPAAKPEHKAEEKKEGTEDRQPKAVKPSTPSKTEKEVEEIEQDVLLEE